jgi:hypothetical protein
MGWGFCVATPTTFWLLAKVAPRLVQLTFAALLKIYCSTLYFSMAYHDNTLIASFLVKSVNLP